MLLDLEILEFVGIDMNYYLSSIGAVILAIDILLIIIMLKLEYDMKEYKKQREKYKEFLKSVFNEYQRLELYRSIFTVGYVAMIIICLAINFFVKGVAVLWYVIATIGTMGSGEKINSDQLFDSSTVINSNIINIAILIALVIIPASVVIKKIIRNNYIISKFAELEEGEEDKKDE